MPRKIFSYSLLIVSFLLSLFNFHQSSAQLTYPNTKKCDTVTNYFGTKIADPYRWLEDDNSAETKEWVTEENKVTNDYLSKIPYRNKIRDRITQLYNFPRISAPYREGEYYFYTKNSGLQNQSVNYYQKGLTGAPEVFLDPNTLSDAGTAAVSFEGFSQDRKYLAYSVANAGSDWQTIYVMDVASKKKLTDELDWVKFSGAAWVKDGFYYSRYDTPEKGTELSGANQNQKVFFHKLGDSQSNDQLIYSDKNNPQRYFGAQTTDDGRFLFVNISAGTSGGQIIGKDLRAGDSDFKLLCPGFDNDYTILDNQDNYLICFTNYNAPNYKVVLIDFNNPAPENWKDLIPEQKELLQNVSVAGGKLFTTYLKDASSHVYQYSRAGKMEREIQLPGIGTAAGFSGEKDDAQLFFSFTSFTTPATIYSYDIASGDVKLWMKPELTFNPDDYVTEQVWYTSKDSTKVPMFLVHKKDLKMDGTNPTLLYGYGGFDIPMTPNFNASRMVLLENGGIYAMANLRGGSEYGEAWHKAGMLDKKQNVFDDFIAAAEYLIAQKYTSSQKLAILGRSNGGLLVGACETQRPDLYKVCFPGVGVLDMLRYHKFTVGWGWAVEYGSSDNADQFKYLVKYSPLHNVKPTNYPATLITTADHDDRVVPAHSFKFAATLQANQKGTAPTLIRIDTNAGHGGGRPLSKTIDEDTDIYSFMFYNMGVTVK